MAKPHPHSPAHLLWSLAIISCLAAAACFGALTLGSAQEAPRQKTVPLPSSKLLLNPLPGEPQSTNSFPTAMALSPDGRYLALLNNGRGTAESGYQTIHRRPGFADESPFRLPRLPTSKSDAKQTYFLGLAFSGDGKRLYASVASLTDPAGETQGRHREWDRRLCLLRRTRDAAVVSENPSPAARLGQAGNAHGPRPYPQGRPFPIPPVWP